MPAITDPKVITYVRETRDFRAEYDGILIGFFKTNHEAAVALDRYAFDLLSSDLVLSAAELDGQCATDGQAFNEVGQCETCVTCASDGSPCVDCNPLLTPADWRTPLDMPAALLSLWRSDKAALCPVSRELQPRAVPRASHCLHDLPGRSNRRAPLRNERVADLARLRSRGAGECTARWAGLPCCSCLTYRRSGRTYPPTSRAAGRTTGATHGEGIRFLPSRRIT